MPLTCSCDNGDDADLHVWAPDDYELLNTEKRRRCSSCKKLIDIGAICTRWERSRAARDDVEVAIHGEGDPEAIWLADHWMCEVCSDLYFSLYELGFECISCEEDMRDLVRQYSNYW